MAKQPIPKKPSKPAKPAKAAKPAPPKGGKSGKKAKPEAKPEPKAEKRPAAQKPAASNGKSAGKDAKEKDVKEMPPKKAAPELSPKILHLVSEEMAIEEAELTATASFKEDLGLDEIDIAELLMQAEQSFGVGPFSEADWESCETVNDYVELIEKRMAAKGGKKAGKKPGKA